VTRLFLIRHGLTDAVGRTLAGRAPGFHLNAEGRAQAEAVAEALASAALAAVISSPLERTTETAGAIAARHGLQVEVAQELNEFDVGAWTGASFAAIDRDPHWRTFNDARSVTPAPGGESMLDVQRRAIDALLRMHRRFGTGAVAVVSHGDVIRAALVYFLGMPLDFFNRLDVAPGRISIVDLDVHAITVRQVNGDTVGPGA
jgi:probable phosphoglycerate mutase